MDIHSELSYDSIDFCHCIIRNGFVFTSITNPANILDAIVIRNPRDCDCWSPKKSFSKLTLEDHILLINELKLEKALIIADDIRFITRCPTLKYIEIHPANSACVDFDYTPLYYMPCIKWLMCKTKYGGAEEKKTTTIDYSRVVGLKELSIFTDTGNLNYEKSKEIEILSIFQSRADNDLGRLKCLCNLKHLSLCNCGIQSLKGIEAFNNLQSVLLDYNRFLVDISNIRFLSKSLRDLSIINSPKITNFSCLTSLTNLEHLCLEGTNELPNLMFLTKMKQLKTFSFSMNVKNGDLSLCLKVPYVHSSKNRRHYNYTNSKLPKQSPIVPFELE